MCGWLGGGTGWCSVVHGGSGGSSWNSKEASRKFQALLMVITSAHIYDEKKTTQNEKTKLLENCILYSSNNDGLVLALLLPSR